MTSQNYWGLLLPLLASAATVCAASIDRNIEEVIVTASPHGQSADQIAGAISVLDGQDLQKQVSATLGETLQNQPGMNNSGFGPNVGQPVLRGLSGKRVGVLQNGSGVSDVSSTSPDHAVATESLLADRIEILRGPATLRFGPGAIGGVINVIDERIHTETIDGLHGTGELRHSNNNDESAAVMRLDGGIGNVTLHGSAVKRTSNDTEIPGAASREVDDPDEITRGYIANSNARADSWTLGSSWVTEQLVIGASMTRLDNNYGIPPGAHAHHEEEPAGALEEHEGDQALTRIDLDQTVYQGKVLMRDLPGLVNQWQLDLNLTDYQHQELEIEDGLTAEGTRFDVQSREARLELLHRPLGDWLGTLGLHYNTRDFKALGEEAFVPPSSTDNYGLYLIEGRNLGNDRIEMGLRLDRQAINSDVDGFDHHSSNLSLSYIHTINEQQRIDLVLSRTERAPVVEELLSNGAHVATRTYEIGNPDLDPESAWNLELNWHFDGTIASSVSLYHRQFSDFIYARDSGLAFSELLHDSGFDGLQSCSTNPADFGANANTQAEAFACRIYQQQDAHFTGMEAELSVPVTATQSLRLWGDVVRARFDEGGAVPLIPPARLSLSWQLERGPWSLETTVLHSLAQNDPGVNESQTDAYTRLDASIIYDAEPWSLYLHGSNLDNTEIRNATSILRDIAPQAGRNITAGIRYQF